MKYERGSFITVPSRATLRGLHPTAQCLYMWLCSYANETGNCYPSRAALAADCGCSPRTIDAMLDLLIEKGLLKKKEQFLNNEQTTNLYTVVVKDGVANPARGIANPATPPSQNLRTELNPILTQSIEVGATAPEIVETPIDQEERPKKQSKAKYNEARVAYSWLPNRQLSWEDDLTQLKSGLLLFKRGETAVRQFVKYVKTHQDDPGFYWTFTKPSDYERKWEDVKLYAKRNS